MTWLLDSNVLVALAIDTHEFHDRASRWFASELARRKGGRLVTFDAALARWLPKIAAVV